jgi:hypothetical protein
MPKEIQSRDWFDDIWDTRVAPTLPIYLRSSGVKDLARGAVRVLVEGLGAHAETPDGMRQIVAYARILASVKAVRGVFDSPDPTPEQVADAVERLMQRVKP